MTPFSQGTRWFQLNELREWKSRAVEPGAADLAMAWIGERGSRPAGPAASGAEDPSVDFVRQAIQRSYQ
jgi:hypothetical protein